MNDDTSHTGALSSAILDSLSEQIALLDAAGQIITINAAWERFARENGNPSLIGCDIGSNYLDACRDAKGEGSEIAHKAEAGIREVLAGVRDEFTLEYPCHDPAGEQRWFLLRATPLRNQLHGAVVSHLNITARIKAEQAIKQAMAAAEQASLAKSEFVSRMSHELRTPLNAILGFTQILELGTNGPLNDAQKKGVDHIRKAGWHLLELINDVLDLARIEANKMEVYPDDVGIQERIRDAMELVSPLAQSRRISMHFDSSGCGGLQVHADPFRLKQVLLNLLSNAIKYNREGGDIRVYCNEGEDGFLRISVQDTGSGIPADEIDTLFQPFTRLYLKNYATEGTGIGLSISKKLVELMNGRIGLESVHGKGSTFWIELKKSGVAGGRPRRIPAPVQIQKKTTHKQKTKILCIDDSPSHLQLMMDVFYDEPGIQLLPASTPRFGLELAHAHKPDLILLDICLPEMTGFEVLAKLQSSPDTANIPVIAVSANAMPQEVERALRAGFRRYITKPIDVVALKKAVEEILLDRAAEASPPQQD